MDELRLSARVMLSGRPLRIGASEVRTLLVSPRGCVYQDGRPESSFCDAVLKFCIPTPAELILLDALCPGGIAGTGG